MALGIIVPTSDLLSIRRSVKFFIDNINRQAQQQEAVAVGGRAVAGLLPSPPAGPAGAVSWLAPGCTSPDPWTSFLCLVPWMPLPASSCARAPPSRLPQTHTPSPPNPPPPIPPHTLQTIGEDLFAIALDQPFRFPAAFTFVLRAFATLEGIGKVGPVAGPLRQPP